MDNNTTWRAEIMNLIYITTWCKPSRASKRHEKDDGNTAKLCSSTAQERHVDKIRLLNKHNTTPHTVIPQSRGEWNGNTTSLWSRPSHRGMLDVFWRENTSKRRNRWKKSIQPRLNPRAPPKDMEKMMGILLYFAAPRRRRDHVDRNRKPSRQRPS